MFVLILWMGLHDISSLLKHFLSPGLDGLDGKCPHLAEEGLIHSTSYYYYYK